MNPTVLTLLTDFGIQDVYVGVMKGVIAQIAPSVTVIDLTHQIPPQQIAAARFNLMNAYPYFPAGTVHVAVVDPGVGSERRAIALQLPQGFLVGPDNGLLSGLFTTYPVLGAVELTRSQYWYTPTPSTTFHGRDIFAAVGAHLATGIPLHQIGDSIDPATLMSLPVPPWTQHHATLTGSIQYIDHFGNLITNIPGSAVHNAEWNIVLQEWTISSKPTYSEVAFGDLLSLIGSHGWVEIAANGGSAQSRLNLDVGDPVQVVLNLDSL